MPAVMTFLQTRCAHIPGWSALGLALLLLLGSAVGSLAETMETYIGEGVGVLVENDFAATRTRALQEAFRNAIEHAVTDLAETDSVVSQFQTLKTRLYPKPLRYIRSYRVLWEYPDMLQHVYRVAIDAEISVDLLGSALSTMGVQRRRGGVVRVAVLIAERDLSENALITDKAQGVVTGSLRSELRLQGFRLVDSEYEEKWNGKETSALSVGRRAGAKVVVVGTAEVQQWHSLVTSLPQTTVRATVSIRALRVDTGEELTQSTQTEVVNATDVNQGGVQALQTVATALAEHLAPVLETLR